MKSSRIFLAIFALAVTISLGLITPGSAASLFSGVIVFSFAFSLAFALVSILAAIPSPADPREEHRRTFGGSSEADESMVEESIDMYTNPTRFAQNPAKPQDPRQGEGWGND